MVKILVWSMTLYASETWTLGSDDIKRLEALEMCHVDLETDGKDQLDRTRRMNKYRLLLLVREQRLLMDTIRKRQRN